VNCCDRNQSSTVTFIKASRADLETTLTVCVGRIELTGPIKNEVVRAALRQALKILHAAVFYLHKWCITPTPAQATSELFSDFSNFPLDVGINLVLDGLGSDVSLNIPAIEASCGNVTKISPQYYGDTN
jgi:hypothetical protein